MVDILVRGKSKYEQLNNILRILNVTENIGSDIELFILTYIISKGGVNVKITPDERQQLVDELEIAYSYFSKSIGVLKSGGFIEYSSGKYSIKKFKWILNAKSVKFTLPVSV